MTPLPYPEAVAQLVAESPPVGDFPASGYQPSAALWDRAKKAGWPSQKVSVTITHPASVDASGWHRPARTQVTEIVILPRTWCERFAELVGKPLPEVVRYEYPG